MNDDAQEAAWALLGLSPSNLHPPVPQLPQVVPKKRKPTTMPTAASSDTINCICGISIDDGFSIACDDCERWCHAACFDIVEGGVPDEWRCWMCAPRPVDKERAVKLQTAKLSIALEHKATNGRRKSSPGVERKRRVPANAADVNKRKRRVSINTTGANLHSQHQLPRQPSPSDNEVVDIEEPWTQQYVPISNNHIPSPSLREKLRRQAQQWRGLTALQSSSPFSPNASASPIPVTAGDQPQAAPSQTAVQILPPPDIPHSNTQVLPPSYSLLTTHPIPSSTMIKEYVSVVTASSAYLSDPLDAYAAMGLPKPFVHLFGPPLDVSLDARLVGSEGRFARSGCRPNAVLRPVLCASSSKRVMGDGEEDDTTLKFAIFAARDIKANEEVVLGWEWDDNHAVHQLPAVIACPHMFPPSQLRHLRSQMVHILHALSSTFTTCACGSKAKDCVIEVMSKFVDGEVGPGGNAGAGETEGSMGDKMDFGPLVGARRGFATKEKVPFSGGFEGVEMDDEAESEPVAGPSGTRHDDEHETYGGHNKSPRRKVPTVTLTSPTPSPKKKDVKGKGRAIDVDDEDLDQVTHLSPRAAKSRRKDWGGSLGRFSPTSPSASHSRLPSSPQEVLPPEDLPPEDPPPEKSLGEEKMPPKMRKRWMHETLKELMFARGRDDRDARGTADSDVMDVDGEVPFLSPLSAPPTSRSANPSPVPPSPMTPEPTLTLPSPFTADPTPFTPLDRQHSPLPGFSRLSLASPVLSAPSFRPVTLPENGHVGGWDGRFANGISTVLLSSPTSPLAGEAEPGTSTPLEDPKIVTSSSAAQTFPATSQSSSPSPLESGIVPSAPSLEMPSSPSPLQDEKHDAPVPEVVEPPPEPPLSPPPPKIKLTLKEFSMRRKKREEEEAARNAENARLEAAKEPPASGETGMEVSTDMVDTATQKNPDDMDVDSGVKPEEVPQPTEEPSSTQNEAVPETVPEKSFPNGGLITPDPTPVLSAVATFPSPTLQELKNVPSETEAISQPKDGAKRPQERASWPPEGAKRPLETLNGPLSGNRNGNVVGNTNLDPVSTDYIPAINILWRERNFKHEHEPSSLPSPPPVQDDQYFSRSLQEEGEILPVTPPNSHNQPWMNPPPTKPRLFRASSPSPSTRRFSQPPHSTSSVSSPNSNSNAGARPLPVAPRALRGLSQSTVYSSPSRTYPSPGSQYIPRGPSADRERGREWQTKSRGRAGWPTRREV